MKKMTIISMMALLVLCASCKKDKEQNTENSSVCFSATVENHSANGKTILNGTQVLWEKGDPITVKSSTSGTPATFTAENAGATAKFYAESVDDNFITPESVYTAYYGNIAGNTLTLPSSQTYVENSFGSGENPMAAVSSAGETKLPFKNICGFLELKLYATTAYHVQNITLKQADAKLWGTGEVSISGGIPSLGELSGGGDELTLNCDGIELSTDASKPTTFHFVVPAGTLGGSFTVTVTTTEGVWPPKTATNQAPVARNDMKSLTPQEVTISSAPEGYVDLNTHVGGKNGTKPLYWAECNLGANNPQDYGDYYAWGHTSKYVMDGYGYGYEISYYNGTYAFGMYDGGADDLSKYNDVDHLTELEPEDDCVWQANKTYNDANPTEVIRMPSNAEYEELTTITYKEWTEDYKNTGIAGVIFYAAKDPSHAGQFNTQTGSYTTSDKHLFIPAAGHGKTSTNYISEKDQAARVWLRTLANYETGKPYAMSFYIGYIGGVLKESTSEEDGGYLYSSVSTRIKPSSIRPVREGNN